MIEEGFFSKKPDSSSQGAANALNEVKQSIKKVEKTLYTIKNGEGYTGLLLQQVQRLCSYVNSLQSAVKSMDDASVLKTKQTFQNAQKQFNKPVFQY